MFDLKRVLHRLFFLHLGRASASMVWITDLLAAFLCGRLSFVEALARPRSCPVRANSFRKNSAG